MAHEKTHKHFIQLARSSDTIREQAAEILFEASKALFTAAWPDMKSACREVEECCDSDYICIGLAEEEALLGWAGLRPLYEQITWELHPLMVAPSHQGRGIGSALLREIERIAGDRGILNIFLGTDDEGGLTSLSGTDLYRADLFEEIKNIRNLGRHPYEFYQKNGYRIVGVVPDASGIGKPDILMCKRLGFRCSGST